MFVVMLCLAMIPKFLIFIKLIFKTFYKQLFLFSKEKLLYVDNIFVLFSTLNHLKEI